MRRVYFSIAWFGDDGKASLKKLSDVIPIKVSDFIFFPEGSVHSPEKTSATEQQIPFNSGNNQPVNDSLLGIQRSPGIFQTSKTNTPLNLPTIKQESTSEIQQFNNRKPLKSTENSRTSSVPRKHQTASQDRTYNNNHNRSFSLTQQQNQRRAEIDKIDQINDENKIKKTFQPYHVKQQNQSQLYDINSQETQGQNPWTEERDELSSREQQNVSLTSNKVVVPQEPRIKSANYAMSMLERFDKKVAAIKENERVRLEMNNSFSAFYSTGDKMRPAKQAQLSQFMLGGYDFVDYSETINKLHRKLLRKVVLDR